MQEDTNNRNVMYSLGAVGAGAASRFTEAQQRPSHIVPQRQGRTRPWTCYRCASASAAMTARKMLAACGAARYSTA